VSEREGERERERLTAANSNLLAKKREGRKTRDL